MKQTPLYGRHKALGAKMIDFGGWEMPVQYAGIIEEHKAVREAAGLFDVSHMGEVWFRGPRAAEAVQRLVTNDVGKLADGRRVYTCACRPTGGIVDDCIVYRDRRDDFLIVVNASNGDKDFGWFREQARRAVRRRRRSPTRPALIAVQGPKAVALVAVARRRAARRAARRSPIATPVVAGVTRRSRAPATPARTASSCSAPPSDAGKLWDALLDAGTPLGLKPIGLGARDTLRLEARLSLYGNDIDDEHTPLEAGPRLGGQVGKGFIGEEALAKQKAEGLARKLVGFVMKERGIARHGYPIVDDGGKPVGVVTRGAVGPTVGDNIGLGYVPAALARAGHAAHDRLPRQGRARAEVVDGPFYKRTLERRATMSDDYPNDLRYTKEHEWARVDGNRRHRRHHPVRRRVSSATSRRSTCRRKARRSRKDERLRHRRERQGGQRPVRAGDRQGRQGQRPAQRLARVRQRGLLRRGLDDRRSRSRTPRSSTRS